MVNLRLEFREEGEREGKAEEEAHSNESEAQRRDDESDRREKEEGVENRSGDLDPRRPGGSVGHVAVLKEKRGEEGCSWGKEEKGGRTKVDRGPFTSRMTSFPVTRLS